MSAITGIFNRKGGSISTKKIKKINDRLSHRGIDGSGIWNGGAVAFGHQMLHTTHESLTEKLPFKDPDSGLVITADARIDNRQELASLLGLQDVSTIPDSYFIIKSYQKWGEKCPKKLLGDFAFALWDPVKEELFCARDHMGVKPFYYYLSKDFFLFSTEIKAFSKKLVSNNDLNELKIALELKLAYADKKSTYFKNIHSLNPASTLRLNKNSFREECYWKLNPNSLIIMDTEEDYFNAFREIFFEAVRCRLRSALPLGYELSGGLDSSSIVCVAKNITKDNNAALNTFSHIYNDFPESDERYFIKKVIEPGGINSKFISSDKISLLEDIKEILWHQDQPYTNSFLPIIWNAYKEISAKNVRVVLSGHGGDIVISHGDKYFIELFANLKLNKAFKESKMSSRLRDIPLKDLLIKDLIFPYILLLIPKRIINLIRKTKLFKESNDFIDNDFSKETEVKSHLRDFSFKPKISKIAKDFHYYLINQVTVQDDFEMIDRTASAFSVEQRYPYFDKRLIEFCYSIPTGMKYKNGWDRYVQRNSMENILPKEIQWRRGKANNKNLFLRNFLSYEKDLIEKVISDHNPKIDNYVDWKYLKKVYTEYLKKGNIAYEHVYYIWYIILLSIWLDVNT